MMPVKQQLQSELEKAAAGESVDGYIECKAGTYIAYETISVDGARYFAVGAGNDRTQNSDAYSRPNTGVFELSLRAVKSLVLRVLRVLPGEVEIPESDEFFIIVEV